MENSDTKPNRIEMFRQAVVSRWLTGLEYNTLLNQVDRMSRILNIPVYKDGMHPSSIYFEPEKSPIYYIEVDSVDKLGFPRLEERKSHIWKRMNFITDLPKQKPLVRYIVASSINKSKCHEFRMHIAWLAGKEQDNERQTVVCQILGVHSESCKNSVLASTPLSLKTPTLSYKENTPPFSIKQQSEEKGMELKCEDLDDKENYPILDGFVMGKKDFLNGKVQDAVRNHDERIEYSPIIETRRLFKQVTNIFSNKGSKNENPPSIGKRTEFSYRHHSPLQDKTISKRLFQDLFSPAGRSIGGGNNSPIQQFEKKQSPEDGCKADINIFRKTVNLDFKFPQQDFIEWIRSNHCKTSHLKQEE